MYTFLTVNAAKSHESMSLKEFIDQGDQEYEVRRGDQFDAIEFDVLITKNDLLKFEAMTQIDVKPKLHLLKYHKIIKSIAEHLEIEDPRQLFSIMSSRDVFIDVELYNQFSYKQLTQLLGGMSLYAHLYELESKEVTICIDNRDMSEFDHLSIDLLISLYNHQNNESKRHLGFTILGTSSKIGKESKMLKASISFLQPSLKAVDELFTVFAKAFIIGWLLSTFSNNIFGFNIFDFIDHNQYTEQAQDLLNMFNNQPAHGIQEDQIPEQGDVT